MAFAYLKSGFSKNVLALFTGTALSQVIPLITAPILARIYLPGDYGMFGLFLSASLIIASLATLEYSSGIIVAKTDEDAKTLANLSLVVSILFAFVVFVTILFTKTKVADLLGTPSLADFFLLVPLVILLQSISAISSNIAIRNKLFKLVAVNRFLAAALAAITSITAGIFYHSFWGLIAGYLTGLAFSALYFSISLRKLIGLDVLNPFIAKSKLGHALKEYSHFPRFSLPSGFINNGINQLPVFLLGSLSSTTSVGYYNMSQRILGLPVTFMATSLGEVFRQRASQDYHNKGTCRPIFLKTLKLLVAMSIIPFAVLIFWGDDIFSWALGEKWRNAGIYTQALGLMFLLRFIARPLSYVYIIAGNLKGDLINHIYFLISSFVILYFLMPVNVVTALFVFALNYSLIYIIVLFRSYKLAVNHEFQLHTV